MKNTVLWTRCFSYIWFVSISRVLYPIARIINIYLGSKLLQSSSDSNSGRNQRIRSCTRVSILPFHPNTNFHQYYDSSLFATLSLRTTGVTRYVCLAEAKLCARTFLTRHNFADVGERIYPIQTEFIISESIELDNTTLI